MAYLPTGNVTFLFSDIEGSTRRWEEQPLSMAAALARYDELIGQTIERHHGTIFKTIGDSFCAVFARAGDALLAAVAIQGAVALLGREQFGPLPTRVVLHSGVAEQRDDDYFGPPLNHIARLLGVGHAGQILLSAATGLVSDLLAAAPRVKLLVTSRALVIWGAVERVRQALGIPLPPADRDQLERQLGALRLELDEARYQAAWGQGHAMSWQEAISYALAQPGEIARSA